ELGLTRWRQGWPQSPFASEPCSACSIVKGSPIIVTLLVFRHLLAQFPRAAVSAPLPPPDAPVQFQQFERPCKGSGELNQVGGGGVTFHQKCESACQRAGGT